MELYEYVQRAVLRPAGMTETFCRVPPQRLGDCANYNYECRLTDGRPVLRTDAPPGTPHDPKARVLGDGGRHLSGHAGLFSTLGDMTRLAQALLSGEVLPLAVVREIGVNRTGRPNADGTCSTWAISASRATRSSASRRCPPIWARTRWG